MNKTIKNIDNLGYKRIEKDSYYTPEWCTEVLLEHIHFLRMIWEPACGEGHIVKVLKEKLYNPIIQATDIKKNIDFLSLPNDYIWHGDIITNPPYNLAKEFVEKALTLTFEKKGKVAMLLRNEWDSAKTRSHLFEKDIFYGKIVLTKRPVWIEGPLKNSPRHNYSWFIWDWSKNPNTHPILMYQNTIKKNINIIK